MSLPFSQACENNKDPILSVLRDAFMYSSRVLEVGSGTGQHAVFLARQLPHLSWQPSDRGDYLAAVKMRVAAEPAKNLKSPVHFDVFDDAPTGDYDAVFTANTCHIMPKPAVAAFFKHFSTDLPTVRRLCIYGPFMVDGSHTSDSNGRFDSSLRSQDPKMGIRDREWIVELATAQGFKLSEVHQMPANNQLLEFTR